MSVVALLLHKGCEVITWDDCCLPPRPASTCGKSPSAINMPRDRDGGFDPVIVPKHSRRLSDATGGQRGNVVQRSLAGGPTSHQYDPADLTPTR
jgi:hypothetical protein